jgi:pimeloyl-ACP methyl ester carboxylesterase
MCSARCRIAPLDRLVKSWPHGWFTRPLGRRIREDSVTLGVRFGIAGICFVAIVAATGAWFLWKRPLAVYSWVNRRALAKAGLVRTTAPSGMGAQTYFAGGAGPSLVLLHGAGDNAGTWSAVAPSLVTRYRLVIPDLAGHGSSGPPSGPLSVGEVLRGLETVLSQGPQEPAIIVGNSLGAWVALLYAHEHPSRVARLVLENGGALRGDRSDLSLMPKTLGEARSLMKELRDPGSDPIRDFVLEDVIREAQTGPIARLSETAGDMERYLLDGRLQEVRVPVDLLWGRSDRLFPLAYAERLLAGLPAARLRTLPGCGHVPHQECPTKFRAALLDILQTPPPMPRQSLPGTGQ